MPDLFMVFDVESIGLHGEGFAVGWVVVDRGGNEVESGRLACPTAAARGVRDADSDPARRWVAENVPSIEATYPAHWPPHLAASARFGRPDQVRDGFWSAWLRVKDRATLWADCAWPVEARFLAACVDQQMESREWAGPYPLHDVATLRLAAGFDPLATEPRRPDEFPIHDPLADARQSARLLVEALNAIGGPRP